MTPPSPEVDWARAKDILGDVLEAAPEDRAAELDRLCSGDDTLRAAVADLLAALDDGTQFLAEPAEQDPEPAQHPHAPPAQRIGNYRIVRELGRGGMGTVYEAVQEQPRRRVALKLLHASIASDRITERFIREAELLAHLDHPNIARVYDAGTHDDGGTGTPYFTMEFIEDGRTITDHAEEADLSVRERIELFLTICDAVQYGHQRGIIHRDLKPGNLVVGGDDRRPRVIDFGVARATGADLPMASQDTGAHEILGTLRYMSPEQCSGSAHEVDVRCDVYALGVVLYEMLMGRLPYELKSTSLLEIPRIISEVAPQPLASSHDSDLDTIVRKTLEKSRDRRYQSVSELADDLKRYLAGEPIEARRDHTWYVLRKTVCRHRTAVTIAAAFFLFVTTAAIALGVLYARAERHAENLRRVAYFQTIALAEHALESSQTNELRRLLEGCPRDLRGWEWWHLNGRIDESAATLPTNPRVGGALSPDGTLLASGIRGGVIEVWDIATQQRIAEHSIGVGYVQSLSFSLDNSLLAVGTRARDPSYVLDVATGTPVLEIPASDRVKIVCMLKDGMRLATGSVHGLLAVRSLETGEILHTLTETGAWVTALTQSPDGTALVAGRNNGTIETWNLNTGTLAFRLDNAHDARVSGVLFSRDGSRLHSSGWDAAIKMWDRNGKQIDIRRSQGDLIRSIALSQDGNVLAAATSAAIELRSTLDGTLIRRVLGQTNCYGVAFQPSSPSGDRMVTWAADAAKIWHLDAPHGAYVLGRHETKTDSVATSPDGRWVASAARRGHLVLWDADTGAPAARWTDESVARLYRLAFAPHGKRLAAASDDGALRVWSIPDGTLEHEFPGDDTLFHTQWCNDDVVLAVGFEGTFSAWSCNEKRRLWTIDTEQAGLASVACSSDGTRVATGGNDGTIKIWTLNPLTQVDVIQGHETTVNDLAWSHDGTILASGGNDGIVRLWNAADGRPRAELIGHSGLIKAVDFSPDGTRLATSAWEGEIRVWETADGACVLRLRGHVGVVMDVDFTADGQRLVSVGNDGTVRVWDAPGSR